MKFLNKLEYKYGKYAIHDLSFYLAVMFSFGLIILMFNSSFYVEYLSLDINKLLSGQIWRIITFLFYPPSGRSVFFSIISIYAYYSLTKTLLNYMSDFKFNLFLFFGIFLQIIAGIVYKIITKNNIIIFPSYFIFSMLLLFCFIFSDATMLFYFIIPIKAKWLGYIELVFFAIYFFNGNVADKLIIFVCLLNVYLYIYCFKKTC